MSSLQPPHLYAIISSMIEQLFVDEALKFAEAFHQKPLFFAAVLGIDRLELTTSLASVPNQQYDSSGINFIIPFTSLLSIKNSTFVFSLENLTHLSLPLLTELHFGAFEAIATQNQRLQSVALTVSDAGLQACAGQLAVLLPNVKHLQLKIKVGSEGVRKYDFAPITLANNLKTLHVSFNMQDMELLVRFARHVLDICSAHKQANTGFSFNFSAQLQAAPTGTLDLTVEECQPFSSVTIYTAALWTQAADDVNFSELYFQLFKMKNISSIIVFPNLSLVPADFLDQLTSAVSTRNNNNNKNIISVVSSTRLLY